MRNVVAFGPRAGRPLRKIVLPPPVSSAADRDRRRDAQQFDLDVGPVIAATDRSRLERLCRYTLRPPLAMDRLEELPDGRLKYAFRHPWRDGTSAVIMDPLDFLARLAALVPAPRRHLLRYYGTLAPNARVRSRIVPVAARVKSAAGRGADPASASEATRAASTTSRSARLTWAELMLRVFKIDVLECPRCQARLKIISTVTTPSAARAILECLGLPARPPPLAAAREREQGELDFDG